MAEAVRVGTVTAHDKGALRQWQHALAGRRRRAKGLSGEALEAAVMSIARMFPENVSRGVMA